MNIDIHLDEVAGDSGAIIIDKARMPPHWA